MTNCFTSPFPPAYSNAINSNFISSLSIKRQFALFILLFGTIAPAAQERRKRKSENAPAARPFKRLKLNSRGATGLHKAAYEGRSPQVLAELCQAGLDVNSVDHFGDTALHDLFSFSDDKEMHERIKGAEVLCWYGGDLDRKNRDGEKPLDRWENPESIQYDSKFVSDVRAAIGKLPEKKEKARQKLVPLITPYLGHVAVLGDLTAEYADAPGLTQADIDAWD